MEVVNDVLEHSNKSFGMHPHCQSVTMNTTHIEPSTQIAVLMGGPSSEHEISLKSGRAVTESLRSAGYSAEPIVLSGRGLPDWDPAPEVVFVAMHGEYGEDGAVQRELEEQRIPYTGCGPEAAALTMDKIRTKRVMESLGISTPAWSEVHTSQDSRPSAPAVVKPVKDGSSVGVHYASNEEELRKAVDDVLNQYGSALVEEQIVGRECTVGILGDRALPVVEIKPHSGRYDFQSKYTVGQTEYEVPARLPDTVTKTLQEQSLHLFQAAGCRGFARVDMLLDAQNQPWFLEINAIPGMTATSLLPKAAAAAGLDFNRLILEMLEYAFVSS